MICEGIITHLHFKYYSFIIKKQRNLQEGSGVITLKMKAIGIISEYNPYHTGHAFLLEKAGKITGFSHAVSVMSGNFSQQGFPMVSDKYLRAKAAAAAGIGLTFELPTLYATGSARDFAEGAISLLTRLSFVDTLCFGVEDADKDAFSEIADCITAEPPLYQETLRNCQKDGLSYPAAREEALAKVLGEEVRGIVSKPNNILGLEYMAAIKRQRSPLSVLLIPRSTDYHSGTYASATGIRNHLISLRENEQEDTAGAYLREVLPPEAAKILGPEAGHFLLTPSCLTPYLAAQLLLLPEELPDEQLPLGMTREMLRRLKKAPLPLDYEVLVDSLKRRNETRGRITRSLLHLMLGIREADRVEPAKAPSLYLNLLAARRESTSLLREIPEDNGLTIITKKADYDPEDPVTARMWEMDKRASDLYHQLIFDSFGVTLPPEPKRTPVIL